MYHQPLHPIAGLGTEGTRIGVSMDVFDNGDAFEHHTNAALVFKIDTVRGAIRSRECSGARFELEGDWINSVQLDSSGDVTRRGSVREDGLGIGRPCFPRSDAMNNQQRRASLHLADSL